jgi:hypothetical protein
VAVVTSREQEIKEGRGYSTLNPTNAPPKSSSSLSPSRTASNFSTNCLNNPTLPFIASYLAMTPSSARAFST